MALEMNVQLAETARIENPRNYPIRTVDELRNLLSAGGQARRDPIREHFYELEGSLDAYYIHVSPITGNVVLLARWTRQPQVPCLEAEHMLA